MSIQPNGAQLISDKLSAFVSSSNLESKAIGSSEIITTFLPSEQKPFSASPFIKGHKVLNLQLFDDYLFITIGPQGRSTIIDEVEVFHTEDQYRLNILELSTGRLSSVQGYVISVNRAIRIFTSVGFEPNDILILGYNLSNKYILQFAGLLGPTNPQLVLAMGGQNFLEADYQSEIVPVRDAEVFIGDVSINPNRMTELLSVKLYGQTLLKAVDGVEVESTRAKVFTYSSLHGSTNPVEFIYHPSVDKYFGTMVGDDIQVEIRGPNFYLTDIEFDIQDGGRT